MRYIIYPLAQITNVTLTEGAHKSRDQTVLYNDYANNWEYGVDAAQDPTYSLTDLNDASLEHFFSRPVKIASYNWATGTALFQSVNPWTTFFNNPRVINRISNFNLIRCKMKLRFLINGNGFHYGRILVSYLPLHVDDGFTKLRSGISQDLIAASQRPHIFLDPTTSRGGDMTLPFVWYFNTLSIPNADWTNMGRIDMVSLQNLKHANGATDSATISIFANLEDVHLSIPTSVDPTNIVAQAGEMDGSNFRANSSPASTGNNSVFSRNYGGNVLGNIKMIPANKMPSMGDAGVRPYEKALPNLRQNPVGNMVNTDVGDTCTKLALSASSQTTVDPRVVGLGAADEMDITSIATRESYMTQFGWPVSAAAEALLWTTRVTPYNYDKRTVATGNELHMTASCFAGLPFNSWRGSVTYRFQIVASAYHKGRIKIGYDPEIYGTAGEYNVNYMHIIDIADERDFEITIGWGARHPYLNRPNIRSTSTVPFSTTSLGTTSEPRTYNGVIAIYVVNELTIPNSTPNNDISINVYTKAGPDIEYAFPTEVLSNYQYFQPQAGEMSDISYSSPYVPVVEYKPFNLEVTYDGLLDRGYLDSHLPGLINSMAAAYASDCIEMLLHWILTSPLPLRPSILDAANHFKDSPVSVAAFSSHATTRDRFRPIERMEPQAGEMTVARERPDDTLTYDEDKPGVADTLVDLAAIIPKMKIYNDIYYGDPVHSIKQLLSRYCLHTTYPQVYSTTQVLVSYTLPDFPYHAGYAPGGVHKTTVPAAGTAYNYSNMTFLNYFTPAFLARRGSTRVKYIYLGDNPGNGNFLSVSRSCDDYTTITTNMVYKIQTQAFVTPTASNSYTRVRSNLFGAGAGAQFPAGNSGQMYTTFTQQPCIEVDLPYYTQARFLPAKWTNYTNSNVTWSTPINNVLQSFHFVNTTYRLTADSNSYVNLLAHVAGGDDFHLYWYLGPPVIWYASTYPAADTSP